MKKLETWNTISKCQVKYVTWHLTALHTRFHLKLLNTLIQVSTRPLCKYSSKWPLLPTTLSQFDFYYFVALLKTTTHWLFGKRRPLRQAKLNCTPADRYVKVLGRGKNGAVDVMILTNHLSYARRRGNFLFIRRFRELISIFFFSYFHDKVDSLANRKTKGEEEDGTNLGLSAAGGKKYYFLTKYFPSDWVVCVSRSCRQGKSSGTARIISFFFFFQRNKIKESSESFKLRNVYVDR